MPWLSILLALLSFFTTKKSTGSSSKALLAAGLVGGATYGITHYTDWGSTNLGALDGVVPPTDVPLLDQAGNPVSVGGSTPRVPPGTTAVVDANGIVQKLIGTTGDVLQSWGGTGTAAVVGTAALALNSGLQKYLPWALGGLALLLLTK